MSELKLYNSYKSVNSKLWGIFSVGDLFRVGFIPGGFFPGGFFPVRFVPVGFFPRPVIMMASRLWFSKFFPLCAINQTLQTIKKKNTEFPNYKLKQT